MKTLKIVVTGGCLLFCVSLGLAEEIDGELVKRGRYISIIAGCNDCHTSGYLLSNGNVPEKDWLTGDILGWRGPWGTTYPANLRLYMNSLSEDQWLQVARTFTPRPPMPWSNVRAMTDDDLSALYHFIRYLGPAGEPAPTFVPPDQEPPPPYATFPPPPPPMPKNP
jgi:hypothetical protein